MAAATVASPAPTAGPAPSAVAQEALAETDREFARMATERNVREAFLAYTADDAILFRPGPVRAKDWLSSHPDRGLHLEWRPSFVEVSAALDLGVTLGPYEASVPPAAGAPAGTVAPRSYGHYVTLWRRQADGAWRLTADLGVEHPAPPGAGASGAVVEHGAVAAGGAEADPRQVRDALLEEDRKFARATLEHGARAAYLATLAPEARLLRDGLLPLVGRLAIRKAFSSSRREEQLVWQPLGGEGARSGDLGYTYGSLEVRKGGEQGTSKPGGFYLRVWERQGPAWRLALDILNPPPPAGPAQ
jgi:ketosteroid isomerase-like protein